MNLKRIRLLVAKEVLLFVRGKKVLLFLFAILALGVLQIALIYAFNFGKETFNQFLYSTYNTYNQFFAIAMAGVLAGVICGEKEIKTWNFYKIKTFTKHEIVTSKILFYNAIALTTMAFVYLIIMLIGTNILNLENTLKYKEVLFVLLFLLASVFTIVNMEIFVSGISSKTSTSALSIVILWFSILIINVLVPPYLGKGYLAPFAQNSFQTSVVHRLLDIQGYVIPFENLTQYPTNAEVLTAFLLSISIGLVFIVGALIFTKNGDE
jgi:ABC-type transport system involved in multi-copper enzyme maturation permease subunit